MAKWNDIIHGISGFVGTVPRYVASTSECRPLRGKPFSHLIYAKAKLAAPEKTTIPRLELQALVLAVKIVRFLKKELTIQISSVHLLSDSQIALYWIHSKKQLKTFVHNRVKLIHEVKNELETANIHCLNQLIPLEVVAEDTALVKTKKQPGTPTRIQPPRKAKKTFIR
ncbi:unnamed protein product [Heligmosomoides polygyrus]|uniref:RNase H domain-containing protein n=1 Tax=Heligmosomoides polygyrus TaxID=6339 RepID=A0A183GWU8_HELPZ|nr:unnamed protein product [Heligmosomoides polygyrus]